MKRYIYGILAGMLLMLLLASCGGINAQQTLVADHARIGTQYANLAITNTVESARVQITLDYSGTQAALIATQSQFLKATLVGRGTPLVTLNDYQATYIRPPEIASVIPSAITSITPTVNPDLDLNASPQPTIEAPTATASPVPSPIITPAAALTMGALTAIAQASPVTNTNIDNNNTLPAFVSDIRLGTSVGTDDCVSQNTTSFTTNTPEIYISARITGSPANTQFTSRWIAPDGNSVTFNYAPDFRIENACIWFFIDQTDLTFIDGNWRVIFSVNGESSSNETLFTLLPNS